MQPLPLQYRVLLEQEQRAQIFHRGATPAGVYAWPLLTGCLAPVFIICILFSTPKTRSQPIFWLQLLAILFAIAIPLLDLASGRTSSRVVAQSCVNAEYALSWLAPLVTDTALTCRLLAIYPAQLASRRKRIDIILFPATCKMLRIVAIAHTVHYGLVSSPQPGFFGNAFPMSSCGLTEYALQIADNAYASALILLRIYRKWFAKSICALHHKSALSRRASRVLLETFTMSFAPAIAIQIALLSIRVMRMDALMWKPYQSQEMQLFQANVYVSLYFSLLATSWSAICNTSAEVAITPMARNKLRYAGSRKTSTQKARAPRNATGIDMPVSEGAQREQSVSATAMIAGMAQEQVISSACEDVHRYGQAYGIIGSETDDRTILHHIAIDAEINDHAAGFYSIDGRQ